MLRRLLRMEVLPVNRDAGLLVLRLAGIGSLLLKHGLEKIFTFSAMAAHFPDPLHIGPVPTLIFATLSDAVCSVFMIAGLATRWAAVISIVNHFVAFGLVHKFQFLGRVVGPGELLVLYLAIEITLLLSGAGRYSVDGWLKSSNGKG